MAETPDSIMREEGAGAPETLTSSKDVKRMGRAEIDTSAPFESVKEAVDRFGGSALWKSQLKQLFVPEKLHCFEEVDVMKMEEQTAQLEKDLIVKERETLDVLKELEMTKRIVDSLKLKLHKGASEITKIPEPNSDTTKLHPVAGTEEKCPEILEKHLDTVGPNKGAKQSPGFILLELQQAKVNLNRTTSDLEGIRASIELLNSKIEKEKASLEKTHERLTSNSAKVSSLEEELNRTVLKLQLIKDAELNGRKSPSDIPMEIQKLSSESEQFKKMTDAAKSEASKLASEIEQTKASIKTAEIRWLAAKKMEEAAKAAEAVALTEIKALVNRENSTTVTQNSSGVTLSFEEYTMLTRKAQEADEISRKKIEDAMLEVDEANQSKLELLKKVEEATAEVKTSRKALEDAVNRVEAANRGKLAVEEALRRWRSEHGQKRRSIQNSTRFKNSYPVHNRRDSRMLDVNGLSLVTDGSRSMLMPALSIGQILSRKLMGPEESETAIVREKVNGRPKVSLGQMLSKRHGVLSPQRSHEGGTPHKHFSAKRKKFGFVGFSVLLAKQNKKNKKKKRKQAWSPR